MREGLGTVRLCDVPRPPAELRLPYRGGLIYVVRCGNWYKIGRTTRGVSRLPQLQVGNPIRIQAVREYGAHNVVWAEHKIHELFARRKGLGEWFHFDAGEEYPMLSVVALISHSMYARTPIEASDALAQIGDA